MTADEKVCPKCGLPIGRGDVTGPLWTPQVKGVEVCGCPSEEELEHERAAAIRKELDDLEKGLEKKH